MRDNLTLADLLDSTTEDFIEETKTLTLGEIQTLYNYYLPQSYATLKGVHDDLVKRDTGGKDSESKKRAELFDITVKKMKVIEDRSAILREISSERIRTTPLTSSPPCATI